VGSSPGRRGELGGVLSSGTLSTGGGGGGGSAVVESRVLLGGGSAVTRFPTSLVSRPELLQAWLELDVARTDTSVTAEAVPLAALLATPRGEDMLRTALAVLVTRGGLRLSPRIALAGSLAPQQIAALGLPAVRVAHAVGRRLDGSEVLSLCFSFGEDAGGSLASLQPFLGASNFAFFVSLATAAPVVRTRWRLDRAGRTFVGDVPIEMPLRAGSEETGEGLVRLRVQLGHTLTEVGLMALESEQGDVLRLACDEEVQILRAWFADGSEVEDLGELGDPATLPLVVNVAPFAAPVPGEQRDTTFRVFLRQVLEPLARPLVEPFAIRRVSGFSSEALGAVVTRWSLPRPQDDLVAPGFDSGVGVLS
jgi:hypothetical protein